jgi:UDP-glucose 4-epimerase
MKYLVVGGSGFLGKSLIKYLLNKGEEVISISRRGSSLCPSITMDISKSEEFTKLKHINVDVIVNCASKLPELGKDASDANFVEELFLANTVGGLNVINFAVDNKIKKVINCSTLSVIDKPWPVPLSEQYLKLPTGPNSAYGLSKLVQEKIMNEATISKDIQLLHLRLSSLYGDGMTNQGILFYLLQKAVNKQIIKLTDAKKTSFDFLHVVDLSMIIHQLSHTNFSSETINVANGKPITLYELSEMIFRLTNSKKDINDEITSRFESFSKIDVSGLQKHLGTKYADQLKPLEIGLGNLIKSLK